VANVSDQTQQIMVELKGLKGVSKNVKVISLSSDDPVAENSLKNPDKIQPQEGMVTLDGTTLNSDVPAKTFLVYVIK
jgi:alpha-L-arabinofuranosidase